jgi:hypothetical protein
MNIQEIIKLELANFIISKLKENILCDIHHTYYGDYRIETSYIGDEKDIKAKDLGHITIEAKRDSNWHDKMFYVLVKKKKITFKNILHKKTELEKAEEILFDLFVERIDEQRKQEEYERNKRLVDLLPENRRNQFLREQKITRILKDKNK